MKVLNIFPPVYLLFVIALYSIIFSQIVQLQISVFNRNDPGVFSIAKSKVKYGLYVHCRSPGKVCSCSRLKIDSIYSLHVMSFNVPYSLDVLD